MKNFIFFHLQVELTHHSNSNGDKSGHQQQQHGKKQCYRDSLEGQDFVNKVSRFEYMTHGGSQNNQIRSPERTKHQGRSRSDERSPRSPPSASPNRSQTTFTLTAVPRSPTLARKAIIKTTQPGSSVTVTQLDENITILNSRTIKPPTDTTNNRTQAEQVNHTPPSGHQSRSKEVKRSPFLSRRTPSKSKSPKRNQSPKSSGGENSDVTNNKSGGVLQSIKNALKSPKLSRRSISKSPVRRNPNISEHTENNNNNKEPVPRDSEKSSCSPLLSRRKVSKSPNRKDPNAKPPAGDPKSIAQRSPKLPRKSGTSQQQQQQQQQASGQPSSPKPHRVQFTSPNGARPNSGSYKSSSSSGKSSPTDPLKRNSYPHTPSSPQNSFQSEAFSVKVTPQSKGEGESSDLSRSSGGHSERTRSASPPGCFSLASESPSGGASTTSPGSAGVLKSSKTISLSFKFPSPGSFGANPKDPDSPGPNISVLRGPQSPDSTKCPTSPISPVNSQGKAPPPVLPKPKNPKNKKTVTQRSASPINLSANRPPTGKKTEEVTWENFKGEKCFSKDTAVTRVAVPGYEPQNQRRSKSSSDNADVKSAPRIESLASTASSSSFTSVSSMSSGLSNGNAVKMETAKQQKETTGDTPNGVGLQMPTTTIVAATTPSHDALGNSLSSKPETGTSPPSRVAFGVKVLPDPEELAVFGSTSKEVKAHRSPRDKSPHVNFVDNTPKFPTAELLEQSQSNGEFKFNGLHSNENQNKNNVHSAMNDDIAAKHETACFDELEFGELTDSQQDLRDLHQRMVDERKEEQRMAEREKQRLDDILNMCAEYEKQLERERLGLVANKRDSCDSLKSEGSRNSMTKIKTNGSLTMLATSPTLTHKDGALTSSWGRRSSNSSASEDDLSGDNGTIKRRPNNSNNSHVVGLDTHGTSGISSGTIGNNSTTATSGNILPLGNNTNSSSIDSSSTTNASANLNSFSSALNYENVYTTTPSPRRNVPNYGQSISHDSAVKNRATLRSTDHREVSDLGMKLNLIGVSSPLSGKPEPWSPTDARDPNFDSSLTPVNLEIKEPITPTSSGIGTASNDSLDGTKVSWSWREIFFDEN